MNFDVSQLDNETRLKILEYVIKEKRIDYDKLGISRVMFWYYKKGKYKIPDEVINKAIQFLTPDELSKFIVGIDIEKVGYNEAMAVIMKALKDPEFREIFLALLQRNLGDYIRSASYSYVVSKEDLELFKKVISKRSKNTYEDYWRYINRLLKDLNYKKWGLRGRKASPAGMDSPLIFKYFLAVVLLFLGNTKFTVLSIKFLDLR
ncbi:hypothetical protein [Saccharolobus islandicus]|uniref:Uncharacterized protein n=2 Tax=Saccharolobus islandicus TaxID=43080 RepID=M9U7F1_SACIS|nr:hypothetical protein [Sulfolobus islandicus]ADX85531.1 archaeal pNOB8-type integrase [Sulfolobus islandicus REY15A]AGJ62914.1 Hypothetical Protein SiL_1467 [Sulfolobus islandicus LAL14/1]